ncbi:MAG: PEP-utilizing enzyme [Candidatus Woesearchaeota archaeon]
MDLHTIISNLHSSKKSINDKSFKTILKFEEISFKDSNLVGDYFALRSIVDEMYYQTNTLKDSQKLSKLKKKGFILTHQGILLLFEENNLLNNINQILSKLKPYYSKLKIHKKNNSKNTLNHQDSVEHIISIISNQIQTVIQRISISDLLKVQLSRVYDSLLDDYDNATNSVHSTNLKLKTKFSYSSNRQTIFTNSSVYTSTLIVSCKEELFNSIKQLLIEFYSEHNLQLRFDLGILEEEINLAIGFEEYFEEVICSGVSSSIEYSTGHELISVIHSNFGPRVFENLDNLNVDSFETFKYGFKNNYSGVFTSNIVEKDISFLNTYGKNSLKNAPIIEKKKNQNKKIIISSLNKNQIRSITSLTLDLESKLTQYFKEFTPLKIHFSILGAGIIVIEDFFLETKHLFREQRELISYELVNLDKKPLLEGEVSIGNKIVHGKVLIVKTISDLKKINSESIVFTMQTDPKWQHYLTKAKAIIVQKGDEFSHTAQMCYEHNIPVLLQVGQFDHLLKNEDLVTIDCSDIRGFVYEGLEKYKIKELPNSELKYLSSLNNSLSKSSNYDKDIFIHSSHKHILEQSHFPSTSEFIEDIFDLISSNLKNQISFSLNESNKKYFVELVKKELQSIISKIAISKFPKEVYINIDSFCSNIYILFIKESHYMALNYLEGVQRVINPLFEPVLKFILELIEQIKKEVGCLNLHLYITQIQEKKEVESLNHLLEKYHYKTTSKKNLDINKNKSFNKLGGVLSVGGIMNSKEIIPMLDFIACDIQELKKVCSSKNIDAISKLIHCCTYHTSKKFSKQTFGLYNVLVEDTNIIDSCMIHSFNFISVKREDFIPLYSFLLSIRKNITTKDFKFKSESITHKNV